jgi:hypothetical protein
MALLCFALCGVSAPPLMLFASKPLVLAGGFRFTPSAVAL